MVASPMTPLRKRTVSKRRLHGELMARKQTLIDYYESDALWKVAVGTWAKLTFEWTVVSVPLAALLGTLGAVSSAFTFAVEPSAESIPVIWASVTTTVLGYSWCLSTRITTSSASAGGGGNDE